MIEFRILGSIEVIDDGRAVELGGPRQRATLATLLLHANRVVSVERIAEDVYAGRPPVTAVTQVQRQISELRKLFGVPGLLETRAPGYRMRIEHQQLDLLVFERLCDDAARALERGDAGRAAELYAAALDLWRGEPLGDLAHEPFVQIAIERLEEMRLAAIEARIEADLACGRHRSVAAELDELLRAHPYRETLHACLMLALYRSGRQADALDAFRRTRELLNGSLGLEPGARLRRLERAILEQDPALELASEVRLPGADRGAVLALPSSDRSVETVVRLASPLVRRSSAELIVARLLTEEAELDDAISALRRASSATGGHVRSAAFTTHAPADDIVRLASSHDVELVIAEALGTALDPLPTSIVDLLTRSPVDVGVVVRADGHDGTHIAIPFVGGEHDWGTLELGARFAAATGTPLVLVGQRADRAIGRRDASRLLADACIAAQRVAGIDATPVLAGTSVGSILEAVANASLVLVGMPSRWRASGLGDVRLGLARTARAPTMLVHRGPRPGRLAPVRSATRFTWTLESELEPKIETA